MNEESIVMEPVAQEVPEEVKPLRLCKQCGAELADGQKFCASCGAEYKERPTACPHCGGAINSESPFCPQCGKKVDEEPVASPVPKNNKKLGILIGAGVAVIAIIAIVLAIALRKIPVERVELSAATLELVEEESGNVSCVVYPDNASDKTVIWKSSDEAVATVDQYGRVTAIKKGTCTLTAVSGEKEAVLEVTVKKKLPDLKAIYDELCDSTWADLGSDGSFLSVDTNPFNKDDGDYTYIFKVNDAIEDIHAKLGLPASLYEDMNHTTWSMGKQEEVFENIGLRVTWTYHPDKGLEVTYKLLTE